MTLFREQLIDGALMGGLIVACILIGFCLALLTPTGVVDTATGDFTRYDTITHVGCSSDSMGLSLNCNDRLYLLEDLEDHDYTVGSIFVFKSPYNEGGRTVHRLIMCLDPDCNEMIFKGDNSRVADPIINKEDVIGKVVMKKYR